MPNVFKVVLFNSLHFFFFAVNYIDLFSVFEYFCNAGDVVHQTVLHLSTLLMAKCSLCVQGENEILFSQINTTVRDFVIQPLQFLATSISICISSVCDI